MENSIKYALVYNMASHGRKLSLTFHSNLGDGIRRSNANTVAERKRGISGLRGTIFSFDPVKVEQPFTVKVTANHMVRNPFRILLIVILLLYQQIYNIFYVFCFPGQ